MSEERRMILRMLEDGKVTIEEAEALLEALGEETVSPAELEGPEQDVAGTPPDTSGAPAAGAPAATPSEEPGRGPGPEPEETHDEWEPRRYRGKVGWSTLGDEIRAMVKEVLESVNPGAIAGEAVRHARRSLREDLRPEEMVRGLFGLSAAEEEVELSESMHAGEHLRIRHLRGDVRLSRAEGSTLKVRARKRLWWKSREDAVDLLRQVEIRVTRRGNEVMIGPHLPYAEARRLRLRIDFTIEVPEGVNVATEINSGDVHADGLSGDLDVTLRSGDLRVGTLGQRLTAGISRGDVHVGRALSADVRLHRGDVEIKQLEEHLTVEVSSGDVTVGDVPGGLTARLLRGDLRAGRVGGSARLEIMSGDVRLGESAGDVQAVVHRGDLELSAAGSRRVQARVMSGDLELGIQSLPAGGQVDLEVMAGDLSLRLAPPVRATVKASTRAGSLEWTVPLTDIRQGHGEVEGVLGGPDAAITARVVSGDLSIAPA